MQNFLITYFEVLYYSGSAKGMHFMDVYEATVSHALVTSNAMKQLKQVLHGTAITHCT